MLVALLRAARKAEQRTAAALRVTLASIGDGVIVTDARGAVTFLNPVAASLTGWTLGEAGSLRLAWTIRVNTERRARDG